MRGWLMLTGTAIGALLLLIAVRLRPVASGHEPALPDRVDFNFHIRPILSDRCYACHGPDENKREAGLRLDTWEGATARLGEARDHAAIVPGDPEKSTLLYRIHAGDPEEIMPPPASHLTLSDYEKALLRRWIEQGAVYEQHWAFSAPVKPELPKPEREAWCRNPIDYFVLDNLEAQGLEPAPEAEKHRLLRRLCFDLTGLPPTPELAEQWLGSSDPKAYERLVDSLLAAPAYGERMAMSWLDLARYSDTHGYQDDLPRVMWPWRDWVIKAFNENMPYDRFVRWQLAGDLLPGATREQVLATGFNRNHKITQEGGVIDEEYRVEYVADRSHTFGKAFLGLTLECARCHDHKYDPFSTAEYYSLFAFFNNIPETGYVPNLETPAPWMGLAPADLEGDLAFLRPAASLQAPGDTLRLMIMRELPPEARRPTFVLKRGQYDQPVSPVSPGTPSAILPFPTDLPPNRLGLADWLFDRRHPLTARVAVNRFWQELFGRGLVATSDNFGMQGSLPAHPELLDWLAADFRDNGWDVKRLVRLIVCSATYRQSAAADPRLVEKDPENIWLARGPRYRMPYEFIRDQMLAVSGLLVNRIGGPPVKPYQPPGLWEEISTEKTANGQRGEFSYVPDTVPEKMYRRSLYTYNRRTIPPPAHLMFDAPMRDLCEVGRSRTSTPLQALVLLNDRQVLEASRVLAARILKSHGDEDDQGRIRSVFRRIAIRDPEPAELRALLDFYSEKKSWYRAHADKANALLRQSGPYPLERQLPAHEQAALLLTVQIIFNLDEVVSKT